MESPARNRSPRAPGIEPGPTPGHSLTLRVQPVHGGLEQRHDHQQPQGQRGPGAPRARPHCSSPVPAPQCAPVRPGVSSGEERGAGTGRAGLLPCPAATDPGSGGWKEEGGGSPPSSPGSGLWSGGAPVASPTPGWPPRMMLEKTNPCWALLGGKVSALHCYLKHLGCLWVPGGYSWLYIEGSLPLVVLEMKSWGGKGPSLGNARMESGQPWKLDS